MISVIATRIHFQLCEQMARRTITSSGAVYDPPAMTTIEFRSQRRASETVPSVYRRPDHRHEGIHTSRKLTFLQMQSFVDSEDGRRKARTKGESLVMRDDEASHIELLEMRNTTVPPSSQTGA